MNLNPPLIGKSRRAAGSRSERRRRGAAHSHASGRRPASFPRRLPAARVQRVGGASAACTNVPRGLRGERAR